MVEDVIRRDDRNRPIVEGTKVSEDVLVTNRDTLFPLQGALGYDLVQSLFVGKNTLLVEGPSDILYLQALSDELKRRKRNGLDARWALCPSGGIDKIRPFVSLFGGNHLNVAVLSDQAAGDKKKIEDLRRAEILAADKFFTFADFLERAEADVEDIFTPALFADIVNSAYALPPKLRLNEKKLDDALPTSTRSVKRAEAAFNVMPDTIPLYDHYTPAAWLIRNSDKLQAQTTDVAETLARAEKIFVAYNALLSDVR